MEAAHTLNNEILKDRRGGEDRQEDSSDESDDSCSDRKPNIQHENKDDLREVEIS
jgi:hypothetical protein